VTLPYPLLLQRSAREALGISLRDHIVIIDEAHNLMDAIAGIYSVSVTLEQVQQARTQLTVYLQKFRNKLTEFTLPKRSGFSTRLLHIYKPSMLSQACPMA
jgi:Rad3-related DNA helicase